MPFTIIPLGINGYMPSYGRETMSILALDPPQAILFDAGTGVARLLEEKVQSMLSRCTDLHIFISHYHLDHVIGLFFLPELWSKWPIQLYAPIGPSPLADPKSIIKKLLEPPFSSDFEPPPLEKFFTFTDIHGGSVSVGGREVLVRQQNHPGGSIAFRIADEFVYATDTLPEIETAEFAKGTKFFLHDVYLGDQIIESYSPGIPAHSSVSDAIELAKKAGSEYLVPIHWHPQWNPEKMAELKEATTKSDIPVLWPVEGEELH
jgi:ribonuclease BN (tRNA processing enzyme)